ncbi:alpha/beta family hydrolase [Endozoicomonas elysicola]|uniref:Alpha/beta hydrolase n=1 Tax=Endozoicomonas elysicola TaxID=305900 RepID=A0A081KEG0_9GAMM|nr:alpha/beta family hydrolase [Endozoicomonas elysicola]KEI72536.1 alpha/beta hydrolase [Endozoicomonas elysicola]
MKLKWNKAGDDSEVLILAHGAGAGMDSMFMERMAELLCQSGITVVRFEFDYMQQRREAGSKRPPDRQPKLLVSWNQAIERVYEEVKKPVFIGGKSMGGRMATLLAAEQSGTGFLPVKGIICLGYPFYASGKVDKPRIEHLEHIETPVLILQGERDAMGSLEIVSSYLLSPKVKVSWLPDGNHDLKPRVSSGHTQDGHLNLAVERIKQFADS